MLALSTLGFSNQTAVLKATPTPIIKVKPTEIPLEQQSGSTTGVAVIGLLIVTIIMTPLILKWKEWR